MNHSIARFLILVALVLTGGTLPVTALAGFVTFTQRSAFDAALVALPGTIKVSSESFDAHGPGLTIADGASLSGLTYSYGGSGNNLAGSGVLMQVSTGFETTSPSNYLGTSDGGVLQSGDDFTLSFRPARAVGMYFISNDPLFDGDITLSSGGTAASLVAADEQPFGLLGAKVYFLGLINDTANFSSAEIRSFCSPCGSFLFNVDDIVTARLPVPSTLPLALTAVGLVWLQRRQRPLGARAVSSAQPR